MSDTAGYVSRISQACPGLPIRAIEHNAEGQYNDVLIVNDELVFRFPKFAEGLVVMRDEVRILRHLRGCLSLPIPDPTSAHVEDVEVGQAFMGYRKLAGEPLWSELRGSITDEATVSGLARQLATFLHELHSTPLGDLAQQLPLKDTPREWADLAADFEKDLFPAMRPDARELIARQFDAFLGDTEQLAFAPALRHGDFGSGNLLYDGRTQAISGIIDFGFAGLGDPAVDIAAAMTLGDRWFAPLADAYPNVENLLPRATFYRSTFALQEALYGVHHNDQEAFRSGLEDYV